MGKDRGAVSEGGQGGVGGERGRGERVAVFPLLSFKKKIFSRIVFSEISFFRNSIIYVETTLINRL